MRVVADVNGEADMLSASNWESYKDGGTEDLDVISGVQIADGEVRLFLLEGKAAISSPDGTARNGLARRGALVARDVARRHRAASLACS